MENSKSVYGENTFSFSIVSHSQFHLVANLASNLIKVFGTHIQVIITINVPEKVWELECLKDSDTLFIRNSKSRGFGANHNTAAMHASNDVFCILNPDVTFTDFSVVELMRNLAIDQTGIVAPLVWSPKGSLEDSFRKFPTVLRVLKRLVQRERNPDYQLDDTVISVDWAAGMCLFCYRDLFLEVDGFNESFFMYLEDVEICHRLNLSNRKVVVNPHLNIVHIGQRASHRHWKHAYWHLTSMIRWLLIKNGY